MNRGGGRGGRGSQKDNSTEHVDGPAAETQFDELEGKQQRAKRPRGSGSVRGGQLCPSSVHLWVCQSGTPTLRPPSRAHARDFVVCLQMANLVTSLCCVVLAAVVVAYAQRRSQLGEYTLLLLLLRLLLLEAPLAPL